MPGKYSRLKDSLTRLSLEPSHQEQVEDMKLRIKEKVHDTYERFATPTDFGNTLINAKLEKLRLENLIKHQSLIISACEQVLVEFLEDSDITSIKMGNGVSLSIKDDVYTQVSDKIAFHQWIRDNGLEDLFSVHYQTMASMVKDRLMNNEDIPPGITPYFKQGITLRGVHNLEQAH